jgi:hypothetical protein
MILLGGLAALFAGMLLIMPTIRVAQGRLSPYLALGLWISGAGFLLLALAALVLAGDAARTATLVGVTAAITGNIVQRRRTKPRDGSG